MLTAVARTAKPSLDSLDLALHLHEEDSVEAMVVAEVMPAEAVAPAADFKEDQALEDLLVDQLAKCLSTT